MPRKSSIPPAVLMALTLGPAIAIGATLWLVADMVPECAVEEHQRLAAPDGTYDFVVFERVCGETEANTQAALVPTGETVPFDAASFVSVAAAVDLAPQWVSAGEIALTLPTNGVLRRDETVAGIDVTYRGS